MVTPRLDRRRRFTHKDGHKVKKKGTSKRFKVAPTQGNLCLPKITHKRLTNKSGFCFKGAINTSPHSRGSKGREDQKPRKGSANFDLFCLLKAAKSKNPTGQPPSASGSTSSVLNSSGTFADSFVEDCREKLKPSKSTAHHVPQNKSKIETKSLSSSESNVSSLIENRKAGDIQPILNKHIEPHHDDFDTAIQGSQSNGSTRLTNCQFNIKKSTENSALLPTSRQCSLSSYQTFAVRLVETFVPEKKRQLPSQGWLGDAGKDLCNIYNKTHSTQLQNSMDKIESNLPSKYAADLIDESDSKICAKQGKVNKTECWKENRMAVEFKEPPPKNVQEEKLFKEKSIKAWVNAIPESIPNKHTQELGNIYPSNPNNEPDKTEREFLRNIRENTSVFTSSVGVGSVPLLGGGDDGYSPFAPEVVDLRSLKNHRISTRELENKSQNSWVPWFTSKTGYHVKDAVSPISPSLSIDPLFSLQNRTNRFPQGSSRDGAVWPNKQETNNLFSWSIFSKHSHLEENKAGLSKPCKANHGTEQHKEVANIRFAPRFMF